MCVLRDNRSFPTAAVAVAAASVPVFAALLIQLEDEDAQLANGESSTPVCVDAAARAVRTRRAPIKVAHARVAHMPGEKFVSKQTGRRDRTRADATVNRLFEDGEDALADLGRTRGGGRCRAHLHLDKDARGGRHVETGWASLA